MLHHLCGLCIPIDHCVPNKNKNTVGVLLEVRPVAGGDSKDSGMGRVVERNRLWWWLPFGFFFRCVFGTKRVLIGYQVTGLTGRMESAVVAVAVFGENGCVCTRCLVRVLCDVCRRTIIFVVVMSLTRRLDSAATIVVVVVVVAVFGEDGCVGTRFVRVPVLFCDVGRTTIILVVGFLWRNVQWLVDNGRLDPARVPIHHGARDQEGRTRPNDHAKQCREEEPSVTRARWTVPLRDVSLQFIGRGRDQGLIGVGRFHKELLRRSTSLGILTKLGSGIFHKEGRGCSRRMVQPGIRNQPAGPHRS